MVALRSKLIGLVIKLENIIPKIIDIKVDIPNINTYKSFKTIENSPVNILIELYILKAFKALFLTLI